MLMNQQEQKWLVLLYSLIELDGGTQRKQVLQHIQNNGYWYRNDQNDVSRTTRNEKAWRNDFSYERQHLVEQGYMEGGVKGLWSITEKGRAYVDAQSQRLRTLPYGSSCCMTPLFYQKFFHTQACPECAADQILLEQLAQEEEPADQAPALGQTHAKRAPRLPRRAAEIPTCGTLQSHEGPWLGQVISAKQTPPIPRFSAGTAPTPTWSLTI